MVPHRGSRSSKGIRRPDEFTVIGEGVPYVLALPDHALDYIQGTIAETLVPYEASMLADLLVHSHAGDLFVDVGANVGNHSIFAAAHGLVVQAYEPNAHLAQAIERSAELNGLAERVTVRAVALGATAGHGRFDAERLDNLGAQEVRWDDDGPLTIVRLDDEDFPGRVAAIKVDVEGMEIDVLEGASRRIADDRPVLYVECRTADDYATIERWLSSRSYLVCDQFNATPTFLFRPVESLSEAERLDRTIARSVREQYEMQRRVQDLRAELHEANLKYRASTQDARTQHGLVAELRPQVAAARARIEELEQEAVTLRSSGPEAVAERDSAQRERDLSEQRAQDFERRAQETDAAARELRAELLAARSAAEQGVAELRVLQADLAAATRAREALAAERDESASRLARSQEIARRIRDERNDLAQRTRASAQRLAALESALRESSAEVRGLERAVDRSHQDVIAARRVTERQEAVAAETIWALRVQLEEQTHRAAEERETLRSQLSATEKALSEEHAAAKAAAADASASWGRIRELERDLLEATTRAELLRRERDRLRDDLDEAQGRMVAAETLVRDLRHSVTFRTGRAVRLARSSPKALVSLPSTLARLAREDRARREVRATESADVSERKAASLEPRHASPVDAAADWASTQDEKSGGAVAALKHSRASEKTGRLRVAAIMDEFTRLAFDAEWAITDITPEGWRDELERTQPQLLFLESAWRGRDGAWHNTVSRAGEEVRGILQWCREHGVPTVFWNKEDPVHYATFLNVASLVDHVFTTDIDRIEHYKAALGHDRVWLLPFAVQPALHNPVESEPRRDAFVFAGAYYARYPDRTRDLESFVEHLPSLHPVEIFDRNQGKDDPAYAFPENYQPLIVGSLSPEEIHRAYKGYRFALNLNSIKQSQTMFARRIFELAASNTLVVSNYSRGARIFFGDTLVITDSGEQAVRRLRELATDGGQDSVRLAALRNVMAQHTYADRAAYVESVTLGLPPRRELPAVLVVARADDLEQLERVARSVTVQEGGIRTRAIVVVPDDVALTSTDDAITLVRRAQAAEPIARWAGPVDLVAGMAPRDHYGPHYLVDLVLATRYSDADVIGKASHARWLSGGVDLADAGVEYRPARGLAVRRALARQPVVGGDLLAAWADGIDTAYYGSASQLAVDRFHYCQDAPADGVDWTAVGVDAAQIADVGIHLDDLYQTAESIPAREGRAVSGLDAGQLGELFRGVRRPGILLSESEQGLEIASELADGTHDYVYAARTIPRDERWAPQGRIHLTSLPGLDLQLAVVFYRGDERLGATVVYANVNATVPVPEEATDVKLGLRVRGPGSAVVSSLAWGHLSTGPAVVVATHRHLAVTNVYPSYDNLYRNAFVHSRLRAYRREGVHADVFCVQEGRSITYREFEGVDVTVGAGNDLAHALRTGRYATLMIHFLDEAMWDALEPFLDEVRCVVWIHGSEVQPWWRRAYNITSETELEREKLLTERRLAFWRRVFGEGSRGKQIHFVFVSRYFAEEVMEDVGVTLDAERYSIVHNPIDVDLFAYHKKRGEHRLNVLSVRPYTSAKYANDLAVKAVLLLAGEPEFPTMDFRFVGDGPHFHETLAPIRDMPNVHAERRFLAQRDIAALHREYGIFLVPTRMDAQGVSRDEAMASGLVPVTSAVAAVPEFVDDQSGILAGEEDAEGLATGILALVRDVDRFLRMSEAAAARVRAQSGADRVIATELRLVVPEKKNES